MESIVLDVSAYAGLAATCALTLNYVFGMLIATSYRRTRLWKKLPPRFKRIRLYQWHNRTAYVALLLAVVHPLLLLLDRSTKFRLIDIVFPVQAPTQKLEVTLGTIAMFALLLVVATAQTAIRKQLSFRTWKNIHLISYGTALLFIFHGLLIDAQLKHRPVDFFDGEKLVSIGCLLLLITATVLRAQYEIKQRRRAYTKMEMADA